MSQKTSDVRNLKGVPGAVQLFPDEGQDQGREIRSHWHFAIAAFLFLQLHRDLYHVGIYRTDRDIQVFAFR